MDPGVPISAAARQIGIGAETLRAWQRRYGLGASAHSPGGHRRYTEADLGRLRIARDLIAAGVRAADAAHAALSTDPDERPEAGTELRRLLDAALGLDGRTASALLNASLHRRGGYSTWETLARPALRFVDSCDAERAHRIAAEHMLSHEISAALMTHASRRPAGPPGAGCVLLACAPEEQHSLPLLALAVALADAGLPAEVLGARTPPDVLRRALSAHDTPSVAVVLALQASSARTAALMPRRDGLAQVAAGPGWRPADLPAGVAHANGLAAAATVVQALLDP